MVAWTRRLAETIAPTGSLSKIPAFPETAPVGFVARITPRRLETETVVPAEVFDAIGSYVEQLGP